MPLSMYEASVPVFVRALNSLSAILRKAQAHAEASGIDTADYVSSRLADDMFPLARQIQSASDSAKFCAARLTGTPAPSFPDTETSFAELQQRIASTIAYLEGFTPEQFEGSETRAFTLKMRRGDIDFIGKPYLLTFALPNFFFHVTTAYDILRHKGVPLGKLDYLGVS